MAKIKPNWSTIEKMADFHVNHEKNKIVIDRYFDNEPLNGYMLKGKNDVLIKIEDATDSNLNSFRGRLNSLSKKIPKTDREKQEKITRKAIEINNEIRKRIK